MAQRKIIWHTQANSSYSKIACWYLTNCGVSYAATFTRSIDETLAILSKMPSIGRCLRVVNGKRYCVYVSHPKSMLRYWYNDDELHLIDIKPTQTR